MEEASSHLWFLRKHQGGSVFGPISFDQLAGWASSAQVAPQDVVSTDQETRFESADGGATRHGLVGRIDERTLLRTNHRRRDSGIYSARRYQRRHFRYQFVRRISTADS